MKPQKANNFCQNHDFFQVNDSVAVSVVVAFAVCAAAAAVFVGGGCRAYSDHLGFNFSYKN